MKSANVDVRHLESDTGVRITRENRRLHMDSHLESYGHISSVTAGKGAKTDYNLLS